MWRQNPFWNLYALLMVLHIDINRHIWSNMILTSLPASACSRDHWTLYTAHSPCDECRFCSLRAHAICTAALKNTLMVRFLHVPVCCTSYQSVPLPATVYGWPEAYIYTVHDRIFGNFPAKNAVYTPYVGKCFWPTLKRCLFTDVKLNACSPSAA